MERSNLRYLNHALDTNSHKVQMRILRTIRHALKSRSSVGYKTCLLCDQDGILDMLKSIKSSLAHEIVNLLEM